MSATEERKSGIGIHMKHPDTKRCVFCGMAMRETDRGRACERAR